MKLEEARPIILRYCEENPSYKIGWKGWCKRNGINRPQYIKISSEYGYNKKSTDKGLRQVMEGLSSKPKSTPQVRRKRVSSEEITEDEKLRLGRKAYEDAMVDNASTERMKLAVQMLGMLIERKEIKVGRTAEEIAAERVRGLRELKQGGYRVVEVFDEPDLLSGEIREDTGQESRDN